MDFRFTPQQEEFRQQVRQFAQQHVAPFVMQWEEEEGFPDDLIAKVGRAGYFGSIFPKEYGGLGLGYVEYMILVEEFAKVDPSLGLFVASHTSLCANHIYKFGSEEQKRRYMPKLATGEWIGCWSFTEPQAGSDAAGMKVTAQPAKDGGWLINGYKKYTTNSAIAKVNVVLAVTDPGKPQHAISAFLVESTNPGRIVGDRCLTMGHRASKTNDVIFENCHVGSDALIGTRGQGFVDCLKVLDGGRISISALALGTAQGAYETARDYALQRRQFGKAIADFQAIQYKLVDMAVEIEAARLLTLQAAELCNRGERFSKQAAMAKLMAGDTAVRVADQGVQIHGGAGLLRGHMAEKYLRDAKLCTIGEGTSEIMKLVIARSILKETAAPAPEVVREPAAAV